MLTIELDYENSKEKLIKSFNKKNPRKEILSGDIYLESVLKFNFYVFQIKNQWDSLVDSGRS